MAATEQPQGGGHRATYSRDNRNGGYLIRVEGPHANRFAGRTVPVVLKDGSQHSEELDTLIWAGKDQETGKPVALYSFKSKPPEFDDEIPF
jgi:hypothetical protein